MMKMKILLLGSLLLTWFCAGATIHDYKFRTLSPEGGFYYDGVKDIEQDRTGFLWVMMDNELYRFDGYHYKKYYPYFSAMLPTQRWVFWNMASDSSGSLYVNTNNGIYRYEAVSDSWSRVWEHVSDVKIDGKDHLWVRSQNIWSRLDWQTQRLVTPLYEGQKVNYVNPVFCTYHQDLYSFILQKIYRFNASKNQFELCLSLPQSKGIIRFAKAFKGDLWILSDQDGLYQIDLTTFQIERHFRLLPATGSSLRSFYVDAEGMVWFGTIHGIYVLDPSDGTFSHYEHLHDNPFSLPNNSVWEIYGDHQSNIWVGTYSGQLCCVNVNESNAFRSWTPQNSRLNHVPVSAFAEAEDAVWIGTEGGGLNRLDKSIDCLEDFSYRGKTAFNNVKSLVMDREHNLWISTYREGLARYDVSLKQITCYRHDKDNKHSLLVDDIRKTVLEADSGLWIAYQYPKPVVSYFSSRSHSFTHYELDQTADYLFDIQRQGENRLWAISNEALYCMDIHTHRVEKKMPSDSIYLGLFTFCLDDSGNIWIGTIGNGLVKFDATTSEFYPMKNLLQQEIYSVYTVCYDNGNVWMGTDNGLYCYDIAHNHLSRFDEGENTQGQVYYPLASMKGMDGKLYFGGTNGFTCVDPKKISYNTFKPKALISNFYIDHEVVRPDYVLKDSIREVVLDYDQTNFGFQFSSDSYHIPEKNRFRYRLRGYNDTWITVDAQNRTAMYSKVPAGVYWFEVYAANNDGVWSDAPTVVKVIRKVAPWLSWPAYVLYFLMFSASVYAVYRHYSEKKRFKLLLYQESLERDKKEQIHQAQLRFFTNISHDFRTPLSLILAALDKLRREGLKEYYYRILNGNVQRLLNLVNELMDFRTVENGMMKLELEPLDINRIVSDIGNDFVDYAKERGIDFQIECDKNLPDAIYADRNVLEKIVMNLLNNSFKYTKGKGSICLKTLNEGQVFESQYENRFTVGDCIDRAFSLVVRDTGIGISGESISSVFERFYKVNTVNADSHLGTGIGLALVKSLVLLHKGEVTIYSKRDSGTDMVVRLPLDTGVFCEADFKKQSAEETDEAIESKPEEATTENVLEQVEERLQNEGKKRILLVEDNADLRALIAESLADEFLVMQAGDGLEALKQIEDIDFDLVVSDIMMPNKDGVSLCHDIKNNLDTSHIPVVLLTAKTSLESKLEGVDSGADLYFEKPIDLTYLKLSLLNIFRNRQQLKEHYAKNYYADSSELVTNEQDNKFLKHFVDYVDAHMDCSQLDVNQIAEELGMSRSKLYTKVKGLTGKSVVEFVLNCRLRRAARLIIEENLTMREVMAHVGIESQAYFTNAFKKVFGETPTSFAAKHKKG